MRAMYLERMKHTQVDSILERKGRNWTVAKRRMLDGTVALTLRHGRREFVIYVPITISGPELWHAGFRFVAAPPSQREMFALGGDV
ncbi:hypothetical protein D3C78_1639210 [compost metagenome]